MHGPFFPAARLKNPQGFLPGICFVTAGHQCAQGCLWKLEIRKVAGTWMSRRGFKEAVHLCRCITYCRYTVRGIHEVSNCEHIYQNPVKSSQPSCMQLMAMKYLAKHFRKPKKGRTSVATS